MLRQGVSEVVAGWQQSAVEPGAVPQSALTMPEQLLQTREEFLATWMCPVRSQSRAEGLTLRALPCVQLLEPSQ